MRRQVLLGQASTAGLLLLVSALFYGRVFGGVGWFVPIVGAALLAGGLAAALGRTAMGRWLLSLALLLAGLLYLSLVVILPGTNFGSADELASVLRGSTLDGWRNALAVTLPIDTSIPEPLGFVTSLAWLAGSTTGVLVARTKTPASPIIPPVLFAALSLPLAAPGGHAPYYLIAALLATSLMVVLIRAVPQTQLSGYSPGDVAEFGGDRMLSERLVAGAPVLLLLALLVPLVTKILPFDNDEPFDPRRLREEAVVTASAVNPLAEIKAQREAAVRAFTLDIPAAPQARFFDRLPLVSLESYDGASWTTGATYSATSADISPEIEIDVETFPVRQNIEIFDASTVWLPAGQPITRIEANDVWYDDESGSLLDRSGDTSYSYSVESLVAAPSPEQLDAALVDASDPRYTALPTVATDSALVTLAAQMQGETDHARLVSLEEFLRTEFTLVADEASGTALGRVEQFLVDGEGYRDQFVTAFAVAARLQRLPTRITVGYRIAQQNEDSTLVYRDTITSEQYDAWPEVLFEGIGWVAFDPVPPTSGEAGVNKDDATQIPEGQPAPQGPTPQESDPSEDDDPTEDDPPVSASVRLLVISGVFLLAFPAALAIMVIMAKMLRRRYRQNLENPTDRVLAGWQESKDRLLEAGIDIRPDMTVKEIVSASRRELGVHASKSLSALAPYVTTTIYSERAPGPVAADAVWDQVQTFDRQLGESRSRIQNVRAKVDPRPLLERV